jgi:hypothetical protein
VNGPTGYFGKCSFCAVPALLDLPRKSGGLCYSCQRDSNAVRHAQIPELIDLAFIEREKLAKLGTMGQQKESQP